MSQHSAVDQEHTPDVHNPKYHHGRSPAAWAGVVIALVGFVLMAVAVLLGPNWIIFAIAAGVLAVAVIVTRALQVLGYGNNHHLKT